MEGKDGGVLRSRSPVTGRNLRWALDLCCERGVFESKAHMLRALHDRGLIRNGSGDRTLRNWYRQGIPEQEAKWLALGRLLGLSDLSILRRPDLGRDELDRVLFEEADEEAGRGREVLREAAQRWEAEGRPYAFVVRQQEALWPWTEDASVLATVSDPVVLAFGMLVAVHRNAGWEHWVPVNRGNVEAVHELLRVLASGRYVRVSLRALYSLEVLGHPRTLALAEELESAGAVQTPREVWQARLVAVRDRTAVARILDELRSEPHAGARQKIEQVLWEIRFRWHDRRAGVQGGCACAPALREILDALPRPEDVRSPVEMARALSRAVEQCLSLAG